MVYTEDCFDQRCLSLTNKAIKAFEGGKTEITMDPRLGGFMYRFGSSEVEREHYDHVRDRVAAKLGGTVLHQVTVRLPGSDQVPRDYLEYIPE